MRSGRISLTATAGTFGYAGQWGHDWSSRGSSTDAGGSDMLSAYSFALGGSGVDPSLGPRERRLAYPLRCLSTVLDM